MNLLVPPRPHSCQARSASGASARRRRRDLRSRKRCTRQALRSPPRARTRSPRRSSRHTFGRLASAAPGQARQQVQERGLAPRLGPTTASKAPAVTSKFSPRRAGTGPNRFSRPRASLTRGLPWGRRLRPAHRTGSKNALPGSLRLRMHHRRRPPRWAPGSGRRLRCARRVPGRRHAAAGRRASARSRLRRPCRSRSRGPDRGCWHTGHRACRGLGDVLDREVTQRKGGGQAADCHADQRRHRVDRPFRDPGPAGAARQAGVDAEADPHGGHPEGQLLCVRSDLGHGPPAGGAAAVGPSERGLLRRLRLELGGGLEIPLGRAHGHVAVNPGAAGGASGAQGRPAAPPHQGCDERRTDCDLGSLGHGRGNSAPPPGRKETRSRRFRPSRSTAAKVAATRGRPCP